MSFGCLLARDIFSILGANLYAPWAVTRLQREDRLVVQFFSFYIDGAAIKCKFPRFPLFNRKRIEFAKSFGISIKFERYHWSPLKFYQPRQQLNSSNNIDQLTFTGSEVVLHKWPIGSGLSSRLCRRKLKISGFSSVPSSSDGLVLMLNNIGMIYSE